MKTIERLILTAGLGLGILTAATVTGCEAEAGIDVVDVHGFHHHGYYDDHHDWHGGYYDADHNYHEDPHDWHR